MVSLNFPLSFVLVVLALQQAQVVEAILKGFAISPFGFPSTYANLESFFEKVESFGNCNVLAGELWRDSFASGGVPPAAAVLVAEESKVYNYTPIQVFSWRNGTGGPSLDTPTNPINNWSNQDAADLFIEMVVSFVNNYTAPFVFLGNENDFYYVQNQSDYTNWIQVYNRAVDAIRTASPLTKVGPVFSYEHLTGNGHLNGWNIPCTESLTMHDFSRVDVVGLSLYPFFNFTLAEQVPHNYLDQVFYHLPPHVNVAFTEGGWPAQDLGTLKTPWEASVQEQITYISKLFSYDYVEQGRVSFVNWLFLYQMTGSGLAWEEFGSISFYNQMGIARASLNAWLNAE